MNNWQKQKIKQGLCLQCGKVPFGGVGGTKNRCAKCADQTREYNRNRYRLTRGIPLDKPVPSLNRSEGFINTPDPGHYA